MATTERLSFNIHGIQQLKFTRANDLLRGHKSLAYLKISVVRSKPKSWIKVLGQLYSSNAF